MEDFDKFSSDLNRRPTNTRSSLINSRASSCLNACVNKDSTLGYETFMNNFEELEDNRQPSIRSKNLQESDSISGNNDSQLASSGRQNGRTFTMFRQEDEHLPGYSNRSYNSSGRPFDLSEFVNLEQSDVPRQRNKTSDSPLAGPASAQRIYKRVPLTSYDTSGREFSLSDFGKTTEPDETRLNADSRLLHQTFDRMSKDQCCSQQSFNRVPLRETYRASSQTPTKKTQAHFPKHDFNQQPSEGRREETKNNIKQKCMYEKLVKDNYYPGAIEDAVNGHINFNKEVFDAVFTSADIPRNLDPENVPLSLLEAFELRIQFEKSLQSYWSRQQRFCYEENSINKTTTEKSEASLENQEEDEEQKKDTAKAKQCWTHRDELKLASTVDIELLSHGRHFPETPLIEAIKCLFKAEKMNSFDRNVHLAEEAIRTVSDDQQELAALKSTCSFKLDLRKDETKTENTYQPLAIVSYVGTTKPNV